MSTYLTDILERKRAEIKALSASLDLGRLMAEAVPCKTDVLTALRRPAGARLRVIAEHKRASPSKGPIRPDSDPAEVARAYEGAGASAMSVLTDGPGFGGRGEDLEAARAAVTLPLLCKDFIVSPAQVLLARRWGADIVLLIVAGLTPHELHQLLQMVERLGMTALIEVHDAHELKVAADAGARLIGVNNRNLHTFTVDLKTSEDLAPRFPADIVRVSESGIRSADDLARVKAAGYDAVLVGEHLMRASDPGAALRALLEHA